MGSSSAERKKAHVCALKLNNAGVDFLESGSYEGAIPLLQNSLVVLKAVVAPSSNSLVKDSLGVEAKLHGALKKLESIRMSHVARENDVQNIFSKCKCCRVDDSMDASFKTVQPCKIVVPNEGAAHCHPDLDIAVVLCNSGIAFYMASQSPKTNRPVAEALLKRSYRVLTLASDVVSNRFALCDDESEECRIMRVAHIVTGNLMIVNNAIGREGENQVLKQRCDRLEFAMRNREATAAA
jgi:hypothetical protein